MRQETNPKVPAAANAERFSPLRRIPAGAEPIERNRLTAWQDIRHRLKTNRLAMFGLATLIVIALFALFAPLLSHHDYYSNDLDNVNAAPSGKHWFGTDNLGRDLFVRTWKGAQISLFVGFMAALIDSLIGVVYGGIMGYCGGKVDELMNRLAEMLYAIPYLLVVILLLVVMPPGLTTIIVAMSITGWINMAWIVRGEVKRLKNQEYALASKALGSGTMRILFRHLIPNATGPILVTLTLTVPGAMFTEAFLSFLGLGVQSPAASWGTMINDGVKAMTVYPWRLLFPALFLSLTMFAFHVFGDGLRDAFDPKLKP